LLVFALAGDVDTSYELRVGWSTILAFTSTTKCNLYFKFPQGAWQICFQYMFIFVTMLFLIYWCLKLVVFSSSRLPQRC